MRHGTSFNVSCSATDEMLAQVSHSHFETLQVGEDVVGLHVGCRWLIFIKEGDHIPAMESNSQRLACL